MRRGTPVDTRDITVRLRSEAAYNMGECDMGNRCGGGWTNLLDAATEIDRLRYHKKLLLKALRLEWSDPFRLDNEAFKRLMEEGKNPPPANEKLKQLVRDGKRLLGDKP
jgi:uncharacterized protein (DUF1778 family)